MKKTHAISPKAIRDNFLLLLLSVTCLFAIGIGEYVLFTKNAYLKSLKPPTFPSPPPIDNSNQVIISTPQSGELVKSPLFVSGSLPPGWMFEGVAVVKLLDEDGNLIATSLAREITPGSWQSGNPVDFSSSIVFTTTSTFGTLVLEKDNPSGLPENGESYDIPLVFNTSQGVACTMEAKICPDGSAVGRSGPKCEFAPCPTSSN